MYEKEVKKIELAKYGLNFKLEKQKNQKINKLEKRKKKEKGKLKRKQKEQKNSLERNRIEKVRLKLNHNQKKKTQPSLNRA